MSEHNEFSTKDNLIKKTYRKTRGNGEGSIFQRTKNGKQVWVSQYPIEKRSDGKYKYKTFYGKTRKEVKEKLENLIAELRTDTYIEKNIITIEMIAKEIIESGYKLNKLTGNSYLRKNGTLEQIKKHYISKMEIQKIQEEDIKDFFVYITQYSNSVISKIYGLLNNCFKKAVKKNIIKYNFLDDKEDFFKPKSKKMDKRIRAFKIDEQKKLLEVLFNEEKNTPYKYQYLLSMFTGMRMGEINALTLDDIDFKSKIIYVTKTLTRDESDKTIMGKVTKTYKSTRELHIDDYVVKLLKEYISTHFVLNKDKLLFFDTRKTYITTSQVNMAFKRLCQKYDISLGYDVNQHMLRHTYATRCIESGMPANIVQKQMGHKDLSTTLEIYTDIFEKYEKKNTNRTFNYLQKNGLIK